jgi:hypothetical protein
MAFGLFINININIYAAIAPHFLLLIESLLVIAAVGLTFSPSNRTSVRTRFLARNGAFSRFARRKTLAVVCVGLSVLAIRVALIPLWGVPQPAWHDEFSFLLAADTFAHHRTTNPTHPMWTHFESFHIIQQPTYMSMYPPGQGLVLAAGQVMGHPWIGQLVITALMCACICWMLQAWLPPAWALLGACLAVLHVGILSYWMNSYFAASLSALGGALVLGALPRIKRQPRVVDALLMGAGAAVLANTRPFEGLLFCLPVAFALLAWMVSEKRIPFSIFSRRVIVPLILILGATGSAMGYYFWRVTGSAFVMPYQVNRATYAVAPYFVWQKARPEPAYRHDEMRKFYVDWELRGFQQGDSLWGFIKHVGHKAWDLWGFYVGPVFTLPLLALPCLFRDRRMRFPLLLASVVILGTVIETWTLVHYLAPALGLYFLLLVQCLRHLRLWRWHGRPAGQGLARAVPMICVAMIVLRVSAVAAGATLEVRPPRYSHRDIVIRELQKLPENQLIIVHYGPEHVPHDEWVYNAADIDAAKIVWARDMGDPKNQELIDYFKDRRAWKIEPDDPEAKLEAYGAR